MLSTSQVTTFKLGELLGSTMQGMDQMDCTPQTVGPALSSAFSNDLDNDTECPRAKGAEEGADCAATWGDHTVVVKWLSRNLMKFPQRKYIYKQIKTCDTCKIQQ